MTQAQHSQHAALVSTDRVPVHRALLSVSDKTDLAPFARSLAAFGIELLSTGGTAHALREAGLDVIEVSEVTGFPEMMDGRVKTLHPTVHGALLARRDVPEHVRAMTEHGITPIDMVCINLYPFEQTIQRDGVTPDEAIEQIDIGGPAILRSAAKNHAFVTVVTSVDQYDSLINDLREGDGATSLAMRRDLAAAAFMRTAAYDTAISAWLCERRETPFPALLQLSYGFEGELRYGENPHQKAAVYANPASADPTVVKAPLLHGRPLSYNNVMDAAGTLELVQDLNDSFPDHASAAIIKHVNPCGAAIAANLTEAFDRAYESDPLAAYGGILGLSQPVDEATAARICDGQKFFEVILAPSFDDASVRMLAERWKNVRLLEIGPLSAAGYRKLGYRSVPGGMLVQDRDTAIPKTKDWLHVAGSPPPSAMLRDGAFAWMIAKHLRSNAIAIGRDGQLLGGGMGQVDRVAACRLAVERAGDRLSSGTGPAVAASDAFFPFPDGPQTLIDAGVRCIVQPGGSKRDQETIDLCAERDVTLMFTGVRHFRH